MTPEEIIDKSVNALMEHFETVQIFVTRVDENGDTESLVRGAGNYFARYGVVNLWAERRKRENHEPVEEP